MVLRRSCCDSVSAVNQPGVLMIAPEMALVERKKPTDCKPFALAALVALQSFGLGHEVSRRGRKPLFASRRQPAGIALLTSCVLGGPCLALTISAAWFALGHSAEAFPCSRRGPPVTVALSIFPCAHHPSEIDTQISKRASARQLAICTPPRSSPIQVREQFPRQR